MMAVPEPPTILACGEVRGGNEPVFTTVELPGLHGVLYSAPYRGRGGGDVHYVSVCGSGLLSRVCLADVAGHGETIAAVGREMHAHLRRSVDIVDERRVLAALDGRLDASGLETLTTAALLTYYPPSRRLTVSYAGHPAGWIRREAAAGWHRLETAGTSASPPGPLDLPLGTGLRPAFTRGRLRAAPGDAILLVTDGVLETPSPAGDEFGVSGVERVLHEHGHPGRDIAHPLLAALRAHAAQVVLPHDDVTFFAGTFVEGPPGPAIWHVFKNRLLFRRHARTPRTA